MPFHGDQRIEPVYMTDASGAPLNPLPVTVTGSALPSGAATEATLVQTRDRLPATLGTKTPGLSLSTCPAEAPTFWFVFDRIAPAANKYMATVWNGAARKLVVQRIWNYNWQFTGVTDVLLEQEVRRISARTTGTSVAASALDTAVSVTAGIVADTNSSAVTEGALLLRLMTGSAETTIAGGEAGMKVMRTLAPLAMIYERKEGASGIVLRQNEGLTIKNTTASTVGTCSYVVEVTDEAV